MNRIIHSEPYYSAVLKVMIVMANDIRNNLDYANQSKFNLLFIH